MELCELVDPPIKKIESIGRNSNNKFKLSSRRQRELVLKKTTIHSNNSLMLEEKKSGRHMRDLFN